MKQVLVSGAFDDMRFRDFRFLDEAAKLGDSLRVLLWSDQVVQQATGKPPKFPYPEREYVIQALRGVRDVRQQNEPNADALSAGFEPGACAWAVCEADQRQAQSTWTRDHGVEYRIIRENLLKQAPPAPATPVNPPSKSGKKVVVTGCFDYFHSGHVRFFEECSELGDLYVVVGHDANIRLLKGEGHPLFPAVQRRFIASCIRYVTMALISSGDGWMDAEPEFEKIKPDIYAVNEDGDKPEKRAFCEKHGIEYRVLKRLPKEGLIRRTSTNLRGF